jgi:hypothetical protein
VFLTGILIPRPPSSEFANPSFFDPVSQRQKLNNILRKRFDHFILDDSIDMKAKVKELLANSVSYN